MSLFDGPLLTEDPFLSTVDPENLPALVRDGQDRAQVLEGIVKNWCTSRGVVPDREPCDEAVDVIVGAVDRHISAGGLVLEGIALWDETASGETDGRRGQPVDLGDLLRMVEERLRDEHAPEYP